MNKNKLSSIGLLQALGLVAYCSLIAGLIWQLGRLSVTPPGFTGVILWLFLLAFSVACCGLIVFGYPVYLAVNKKIKEALHVLIYTLLYCLGIIAIIIVVLFSLI